MTARGRTLDQLDPAATVTGLYVAAELKLGELIAGRFRVEELLGVGGMGVVYRAHDEQLHVPVALKLLRPELAAREDAFARFRQELLLARQVSSPHVVRIHDLVAHQGRWLISMDFIAGASLEKLIDERGPLPVDEALKIARQIALGLGAAAQRKVVHRDLKPANVLVSPALEAYITDFGVARSAGVTGITGSGVIVGTPAYLSPEQARAEAVDHRSDLYALGLILYEMLTGKSPFPAGTPAEMLAQRITREPPSLRRERVDAPAWVERLVARLLQLRPARRFQSAEAVVRAIDAAFVPWTIPDLRRVAPAAMAVVLLGVAFALGLGPGRSLIGGGEVATLQRGPDLALLPIAHDAADAELAAAITDLLTETLHAADAAVADAARVTRALRLLSFDTAAAVAYPARVAEQTGARRLISGRLVREHGRLRLQLSLLDPRDPSAVTRVDSGPITLEALGVASARVLGDLGLPVPLAAADAVWPHNEAALNAFGAALAAIPATAVATAWEATTGADPSFALGWARRIEHALQTRSGAEATRAAAEATVALKGGAGRDRDLALALAALADGDAAAAIEGLRSLAAATPQDHGVRLLLARAYESAGDNVAAKREVESITEADGQNPDAWLELARLALDDGEAQRATDDYLLRAGSLYARLGDRVGQANALQARGVGYERLGQLDAARDAFRDAAAMRSALGDTRGAASSRRDLAWTLALQGDIDGAREALTLARAAVEPLGDPGLLAALLNDDGLIAEEAGDYRAALVSFREAHRLRQSAGDNLKTAEAGINVGYAYYQLGEFANAEAYFLESERAYVAAEDARGMVMAAQNLALIDAAAGRIEAARARLTASIASAEPAQMSEEAAVSRVALADLLRLAGRSADALAELERAARGFEARGDDRGAAEAALVRALVFADLADWEAAEVALAPLRESPPAHREQNAKLALLEARVAYGRGDLASAAEHLGAARAAAEAARSTPTLARTHLIEARLALQRGERERARAALAAGQRQLTAFPAFELELEIEIAAIELDPPAAATARYDAVRARVGDDPMLGVAARLHRAGGDALVRARRIADASNARARERAAYERLLAAAPKQSEAALSRWWAERSE
jgi:tetratricopeptide (TPR) repeat protein